MSEELVLNAVSDEEKKQGFKSVCLRLGIMMIAVFISRAAASVILSLVYPSLSQLDPNIAYIIESVISFLFLYVIPISAAILLLKPKKMCSRIYKKPQYFGSAMGMFPAFYGLAIFANLITIIISSFFRDTDLNESFNTVNELAPDGIVSAIVLFVQLAVIAPVFEEFWFRGIVMESLRPYGNGFAIFVSALLFGLTHANFGQLFYTAVIGICLGYIAISTKSIVTTTIMHAILNSISGIMLILISTEPAQRYLIGKGDNNDPVVILMLVYMFFVIMLMIVGIFMAIFKLRKIRRYRVEKMWDVSSAKRWGIFLSRVTVIVMLVLAIDTLTFRYIPTTIIKLITGTL